MYNEKAHRINQIIEMLKALNADTVEAVYIAVRNITERSRRNGLQTQDNRICKKDK